MRTISRTWLARACAIKKWRTEGEIYSHNIFFLVAFVFLSLLFTSSLHYMHDKTDRSCLCINATDKTTEIPASVVLYFLFPFDLFACDSFAFSMRDKKIPPIWDDKRINKLNFKHQRPDYRVNQQNTELMNSRTGNDNYTVTSVRTCMNVSLENKLINQRKPYNIIFY